MARLIDRPIRPLFPESFRCETQVQATVLSFEPGTDPEVLAIIGAAAALQLSEIPFEGPVAAVRLALTAGGDWVAFPDGSELSGASAGLVMSLSPAGLVMMEGEAREISEAELTAAVQLASIAVKPLLELIQRAAEAAGRQKRPLDPVPVDEDLRREVEELAGPAMAEALRIAAKKERNAAVEAAAAAARALILERRGGASELGASIDARLHDLEAGLLRRAILEEGRRADGRGLREIRPISCAARMIPRVHGSALFTRGETQALVVATLGTGQDEQEVETLRGVERERFHLFYTFPPYSVGEVRPLRGPGRREIGHGNLARRALEAVLPPVDIFPYTIKVESEITSSNGSSSMATVCGGCLALMDAGVPIRRPVAGIAMGLVLEGERSAVLSDIIGVEDHLGDMDFKVAGTEVGITAVQLDNKLGALPLTLLEPALEQAREGRLHILGEMARELKAPRPELSLLAPRIAVMKIRPHRIRELIGPGGRTIQDLQADTGTRIDVKDDGTVRIYAPEAGAIPHAQRRIWYLTGEPKVGACYRGTVTGVKDFGCFVRIFQGIEGLVPARELHEPGREEKGAGLVEGESVVVKVLGAEGGRIQLSRKAAAGIREEEIDDGS